MPWSSRPVESTASGMGAGSSTLASSSEALFSSVAHCRLRVGQVAGLRQAGPERQ